MSAIPLYTAVDLNSADEAGTYWGPVAQLEGWTAVDLRWIENIYNQLQEDSLTDYDEYDTRPVKEASGEKGGFSKLWHAVTDPAARALHMGLWIYKTETPERA